MLNEVLFCTYATFFNFEAQQKSIIVYLWYQWFWTILEMSRPSKYTSILQIVNATQRNAESSFSVRVSKFSKLVPPTKLIRKKNHKTYTWFFVVGGQHIVKLTIVKLHWLLKFFYSLLCCLIQCAGMTCRFSHLAASSH